MSLSHTDGSVTEVDLLIESLKSAAATRDFVAFEKWLSPYFPVGDLSLYPLEIQAYLNYFTGYYYIHAGKSENKKESQEKGKDYLTRAIDNFRECGLPDEAIEAQISLGWADYQLGEVSNYEAYLLDAGADCPPNSDGYFSVCVSLLIVYYAEKQIEKGIQLIESIGRDIIECRNVRILCQFYNNAGLIYQFAERYREAVAFYERAITLAQNLKNRQFEALSLNCLAYCYYFEQNYDLAAARVEAALQIFKNLNDHGHIAEALDTKAIIQAGNGQTEEGLTTINAALSYFRQGENYAAWAESLWNKIEILLKMEKKMEIYETFRELSNLTNETNLDLQRKYYRNFADLTIIPFGATLDEKVDFCKSEIILPIVADSPSLTAAAKKLGEKSHHNISNFLKKREQKEVIETNIERVAAPKNFVLPEDFGNGQTGYYQADKQTADAFFGVEKEIILFVQKRSEGGAGDLFVLKTKKLILAELVEKNGNFYFEDGQGKSISSGHLIIGQVIGYGLTTDGQVAFEKV